MSDFPFSIPRRDADVVNGVSYAGDTLTLTRAEGSDLTTTIATSDPTKIENGNSSMEIATSNGDCVFTPNGDSGLTTTFAADGKLNTKGIDATSLTVGGSTGTVVGSHSIYYNGSSGTGTANGIAFKWTGTQIMGRVDNTTDIVVGTLSDRRVKRNIKSITNEDSRKFLDVIKPRSYNQAVYEKDGLVISGDRDELIYGGVAQEIEEHFPEVVSSPENDELKCLYSEPILFLTISSLQLVDKNVKDLQTTIEKLEERLAALENN